MVTLLRTFADHYRRITSVSRAPVYDVDSGIPLISTPALSREKNQIFKMAPQTIETKVIRFFN